MVRSYISKVSNTGLRLTNDNKFCIFLGSRDPYHISGEGAGFDFHWEGGVLLEAGYPNNENELIQLTSETMEVIVPEYVDLMQSTDWILTTF